jgi:uncharacterized coiled-coil DUF342 family protein
MKRKIINQSTTTSKMDYEDLLKIQKKKENGEKLTFEEVKILKN